MAARGRLAALLFVRLLALSVWLRRRFGWHAGRVLFRPLLARIGPKLRLLVSGGAALEERLIWQLEGLGWTVRNGYGLAEKIGRAHVCTPVTNAHLVCRLRLEKKNKKNLYIH